MTYPYEPPASPAAASPEPPAASPEPPVAAPVAAAPEPKPEPSYAQFQAARGGNEKAAAGLPEHADIIPTDAQPWLVELLLKILHKL